MGYVFEYSKNDEPIIGTCTENECAISRGEICIGEVSETEAKDILWKHWSCVTPDSFIDIKLAVTGPGQIRGWDELLADDKERIQKAWIHDTAPNYKPDNKDDVLATELKADDIVSANQNQADPEIVSNKTPSLIEQVQTTIINAEEITIFSRDTAVIVNGEKNTEKSNEEKTEVYNKEETNIEVKNDVINEEIEAKNEKVADSINKGIKIVANKEEKKDELHESTTDVTKVEVETGIVNHDTSSSSNIEMTTDLRTNKKRTANAMEDITTVEEQKTVTSNKTSRKVRNIKPARTATRRSPRFVAEEDKKEKITPSAAKKRKIVDSA